MRIDVLQLGASTARAADVVDPEMRFIIYREEFAHGRRTDELRDCLFASESEAIARRKQRELFTGEVHRYRQTYRNIGTEQKNEILIVRAPEHGRFVGVGLSDELRPETHVTGIDVPELD
jgi:hypothetical protein